MEEPGKTAIREPYEAPSVDDVPLESSDMMVGRCKSPTFGVGFAGNSMHPCRPGFGGSPCKSS